VSVPTAAIRIDPPLPLDGADQDRLDAVVVPPDAAVRELLDRWWGLAAGVLEQDDRTLTVLTTRRWLRALADALPGISISPAGIARPVPAGQEPVPEADYAFDALPGGLPLTLALTRLLRRAGREAIFAKPFSEPNLSQLMRWLSEPVDSAAGLPRYLAALRDRRSDLRERWPRWKPAGACSIGRTSTAAPKIRCSTCCSRRTGAEKYQLASQGPVAGRAARCQRARLLERRTGPRRARGWRAAIDERLVETVARLAEGEAHHAQALDRLEERLAQLEASAAPAEALAHALSVLRRLER
jgi:hypothetical protein